MLDTDICVHIARGTSPAAERRFLDTIEGEVVISAIGLGELHYGCAKSTRRAQSELGIELVLQYVPVADLGANASRIYGDLRAALETQGGIIGNNDLWIAARALSLGLILVTNNTREFSRVPGPKVENWLQDTK